MPGYYLIDGRTKTITPVSREMLEDRSRIESSTRRIVPVYSSEIQRYLKQGYRMKNPYMGFNKLVQSLRQRGARDARALAAWIGRRKYGKQFSRRNPDKPYMVTVHDRRGRLIESAHSDTLEEAAGYLSREVPAGSVYWSVWKAGGQLAGDRFSGEKNTYEWLERIVSGGVRWSPMIRG